MTPYYEDDLVTIFHARAEDVVADLEPGSVSLVAVDPPYHGVISEAWDNEHDSDDEFIEWIGQMAASWSRVATPNGSLYCWAWPRLASRVELAIAEHWTILNNITWAKPNGRSGQAEKESLRRYFSDSERCVFAEKPGADGSALKGSGYAAADAEARAGVFEPLRRYLADERDVAGFSNKEIDLALGYRGMASHWFGSSQWQLPSAEQYERLRELFNGRSSGRLPRDHQHLATEHRHLKVEYDRLRAEYSELREQFEELRRPFNTSKRLPYRDVWTHDTVPASPNRHPCAKPIEMMRDIITISSRPGDLVLDCFAGSGSTLLAARDLGRCAIGVDSDEKWCEQIASKLSQGILDLGAAA